MARTILDIDLDALPADDRGAITWAAIAAEHGADHLIDVAVCAIAKGRPKLARNARAAHVRELMRADGLTGRRGRPMKGRTRRDARLVVFIEQSVKDQIARSRGTGESYADVITRWATEHGVKA